MTVYELMANLAIVALVLTVILGLLFSRLAHARNHLAGSQGGFLRQWKTVNAVDWERFAKKKSVALTWFLQYFMGSLLLFSGFVKAADPLGTVYKMKDYFDVFAQQAFPFTDFLKENVYLFSIIMLVLELALGIYFILGMRGKWNSVLWVNLMLMLFFTFLTGFNYYTGYVPQGENFFNFEVWGKFQETNIRITDCGCFGDFMKLAPIETFLKDVFLSAAALFLLVKAANFRTILGVGKPLLVATSFVLIPIQIIAYLVYAPVRYLYTSSKSPSYKKARSEKDRETTLTRSPFALYIFVLILDVLLFCFCLSNYLWGLPVVDFRPFHEQANIREYIKQCDDNKDKFLTDLVYRDLSATDSSERLMIPSDSLGNYDFRETVVVNGDTVPRLKYVESKTKLVKKGCYSIAQEFGMEGDESPTQMAFKDIRNNDGTYLVTVSVDMEVAKESDFERLNALVKAAKTAGEIDKFYGFYQISRKKNVNPNTEEDLNSISWFQYDDKLLKTIIRANPGLLLIKDGVVLKKWHNSSIPTYEGIKPYLN